LLIPLSLKGVAGVSCELLRNSHSQGKLSLPLTSLTGYSHNYPASLRSPPLHRQNPNKSLKFP
ncbi:MAG: hypothetical protein ACPLPS_03135, partial [bacterium]